VSATFSLDKRQPVALYIHFPFCLSICPYCDFVVYAGRKARGPAAQIDRFVAALIAEIGLRAHRAPLRSVYLGGGTPSLLSAAQVQRILGAVATSFGIADGAEITLEANPGDGERGDLSGFRAAGVNRLSIGAQSFDTDELKRLGRRHKGSDVAATVAAGRAAGFDNLSLDLLYDVPGQTTRSWRKTLDSALKLEPDHVSAYALDLAGAGESTDHLPITRGARQWRTRARAEQDDDRAATFYEMADEAFAAAGLQWYELSNWSRPGRESRHNLAYWLGNRWEAVGPGAHAFDGTTTRRWNLARLDGYLDALAPAVVSDVRLPPSHSDTSAVPSAAAESAILRLRTVNGLKAAEAAPFAAALAWARSMDLAEDRAGRVVLTLRGRLLANELFVRMLPASEESAA
jgi:oxygen-independent coproporphyrinogen-3 oxidase